MNSWNTASSVVQRTFMASKRKAAVPEPIVQIRQRLELRTRREQAAADEAHLVLDLPLRYARSGCCRLFPSVAASKGRSNAIALGPAVSSLSCPLQASPAPLFRINGRAVEHIIKKDSLERRPCTQRRPICMPIHRDVGESALLNFPPSR